MSSLELEGPDFEKTVHDHARYLGLDPQRHPQLLWIAVEALTAKVPSDWRVAATKSGSAYFYNTRTRETMWEHPLDEKFKSMVREHLSRLGELTLDEEGRAVGGKGRGNAFSQQHLPSSLSRPDWRRSPADEKPPRQRRGNADGAVDSGDDSDSHSQESRDAIVELESRLMQEVAQNKILQDQLEHEQALNRQYQARSAEADVTILKLRGEVAEHKSSLVASQSGENNQVRQRVFNAWGGIHATFFSPAFLELCHSGFVISSPSPSVCMFVARNKTRLSKHVCCKSTCTRSNKKRCNCKKICLPRQPTFATCKARCLCKSPRPAPPRPVCMCVCMCERLFVGSPSSFASGSCLPALGSSQLPDSGSVPDKSVRRP